MTQVIAQFGAIVYFLYMAAGPSPQHEEIVAVNRDTFTAMMEQLQESLVTAVAATIGCNVERLGRDNYGFDLLLVRPSRVGAQEASLFVQLKSTTLARPAPGATHFGYRFNQREYFERLTRPRTSPKGLLVVMTVPRRQLDWTSTSHTHSVVRHACYWMNLEGDPVPPGERPTVSVPTANIFACIVVDAAAGLRGRGEAAAEVSERTPSGLGSVDPPRVVALLQREGWRVAGARAGSYVRLVPPGGAPSVLVPLDLAAPDFAELFEVATRTIARSGVSSDWAASPISQAMLMSAFDKFEFRKESRAPSGFIPWSEGEGLFAAARAALSSAAKAAREVRQYFGNRHGQFANRYLDQVLMGQTEPGSFVVTAYAPPNALVPLRGPQTRQQLVHFDGIDAVSARTIAQSLTRAMGAAQEAVEHAHRTDELSGFDAGIESGVSFELATALFQLTSGADDADVTHWSGPRRSRGRRGSGAV